MLSPEIVDKGVYLRLALVAAEAPKVRWPRELEVAGSAAPPAHDLPAAAAKTRKAGN